MKRFIFVVAFIVLVSCSKNPKDFLTHINGYWEIDQVIFINGDVKTYKYNESIDYISINDSLKGFRKKLKPGFNSKYITSKDAEGITAKIENDSLNLYYKTSSASWKETVLDVNKNQLKIVNDTETIYVYKRHETLKLD